MGHRDGCRRWVLKGQVKAGYHAAGDIDRQRQPGTLQWLAVYSIDDEEIDQCVINLHDLHGVPC